MLNIYRTTHVTYFKLRNNSLHMFYNPYVYTTALIIEYYSMRRNKRNTRA